MSRTAPSLRERAIIVCTAFLKSADGDSSPARPTGQAGRVCADEGVRAVHSGNKDRWPCSRRSIDATIHSHADPGLSPSRAKARNGAACNPCVERFSYPYDDCTPISLQRFAEQTLVVLTPWRRCWRAAQIGRRHRPAFAHSRSDSPMPLRKAQLYRWLLARAMARQAAKCKAAIPDRRRWNFPTNERRRAEDRTYERS